MTVPIAFRAADEFIQMSRTIFFRWDSKTYISNFIYLFIY